MHTGAEGVAMRLKADQVERAKKLRAAYRERVLSRARKTGLIRSRSSWSVMVLTT